MQDFAKKYIADLKVVLDSLDTSEIEAAVALIQNNYYNGKLICVAGNGGSASMASHFVNDLNKGTLGHKGDKNIPRFKAVCLNDSISLVTAWANDLGYDHIFAEQLKNFAEECGLFIAFSSSGNSENVVNAAKEAKKLGIQVLSLTAFSGGKLKEISDVNVFIPINSYQLSEDVHLILGHMVISYFYESLISTREKSSLKDTEAIIDKALLN